MINGRITQAWKRAIPPHDLDDLLVYVSATWEQLRAAHPVEHAYQNAEPDLTISLCEYLNLVPRKQRAGVNGSFAAEAIEPIRVGGRIVRNGRSDIRFTLGVTGAPEIVLEFKKLDGTSAQRAQYVDEGILRFVHGKYAGQFAHGVMIGLCCHNRDVEQAAISGFIEAISGNVIYACLADRHGRFVHSQCSIAPTQADFGTRHSRQPAVGIGPITLAHRMLNCPPHAGFVAMPRRKPAARSRKLGARSKR